MVLAVLGAVVALAVPASSMGSMSPVGHKFEIAGGSSGPTLSTSLGSCGISKITGQIPTTAGTSIFDIPTPTVGSCTSGTSLTLSGQWRFSGSYYLASLSAPAESLTMRFASLPGCKLTSPYPVVMYGTWDNGLASPAMKSAYHAEGGATLNWANDGGSCALSGKQEYIAYEDVQHSTFTTPATNLVTDLTSPTTPILVTP
jgi:hypothetical protein